MPRKTPKPWTVLIYMVADDPQGGELLDQQAVREMDQITKAALSVDTELLNVAVQIDFRTLPGVWRRVIGESTFVMPEGNAVDPETLYGFFEWAATECPAEHYLLIFWGHSRGQFGIFGDPDPFEYTAQTLTLDELRVALTAAKRSLGRPMDVIAFKDCFMATLETAYELTGLADYLLASPTLVPVVGWPYQEMFESLANNEGVDAAKGILSALEGHYKIKKNADPFKEVPYSLLSTVGAAAVVKHWEELFGKGHTSGMQPDNVQLRSELVEAASKGGDPALVDLGVLVPKMLKNTSTAAQELVGKGQAAPPPSKLEETLAKLAAALGNASPAAALVPDNPAGPDKLVIRHTGGTTFGGVGVFAYPSSPKAQRESRLTRLADEKVYRRLAISTDTNWADIALQNMPLQRAQPDVSKAIAVLEQLQRLGVGMAPGSAARATGYMRRIARRSRDLTDAEVAEAAEYAAIAELAARLASFAAAKGGEGFAKGGDGFAKGGDGFAKGGDGFAKGGDGFVG